MKVILLERIAKLGQMGDIVDVKPGFARNFLLPKGKALRANDDNMARFENQKAQLEAQNLEARGDAEAVKAKLDGQTFIAVRQAGESGQLYGSVSPRDIAQIATEAGFTLSRGQIVVSEPIKTVGMHQAVVNLHPEVSATITMNVARSEDEAERQAQGENIFEKEKEDFVLETFDEDEEDGVVVFNKTNDEDEATPSGESEEQE